MNFWSFLTICFCSLMATLTIVQISILICNAISSKRKIEYVYKILDRTTGDLIEVDKDVFDMTYKALEHSIKQRNHTVGVYNQHIKGDSNE